MSETKNLLEKNIPSIGIRQMKEIIRLKILAKEMTSLLFVGRHGIGKSEGVAQVAREVGWEVIDKRFSCLEIGDLAGVQDKDPVTGKKTVSLPPDWFPLKGEKDNVILLLDEFIRAHKDLKNGAMQITQDRMLNGHHLPDNCLVIACINDGEEYDTVGGLDAAQQDRFQVFEVDPPVDEWVDWAVEAGINKYVLDFIRAFPSYLDAPKFREDMMGKITKFSSRRSWHKFSNMLNFLDKKPTKMEHLSLGASYIGFEAAVNFLDHCASIKDNVPLDDILAGKDVFTGMEQYWKDITTCTTTLTAVADWIANQSKTADGFTSQTSQVSKETFAVIRTFFLKLSDLNKEASAYFFVKVKKVLLPIDLNEHFLSHSDVAEKMAELFPETAQIVKSERSRRKM